MKTWQNHRSIRRLQQEFWAKGPKTEILYFVSLGTAKKGNGNLSTVAVNWETRKDTTIGKFIDSQIL